MNKLIHRRKLTNKILAIFLVMISFNLQLFATKVDSLRLENQNGKNFVIHKVNKGQTLLSTLRRYGCSLNEFKAENPGIDLNINVDQKLRIPYKRAVINETKITQKKNTTDFNEAVKTIIVQPGMTLFSIAKKYGLTLEELKQINNLNSNVAKLGEKLVVKQGKTNIIENVANIPVVASKPEGEKPNSNKIIVREVPAITNKKTDENISKEEVKIKSVSNETVSPQVETKKKVVTELPKVERVIETKPNVAVVELPKTDDKKNVVLKDSPLVPALEDEYAIRDKKVEEGIAEFISVESNSGKYLALHKTAPSGTLIQVKNETNGASVWVKVIGKLPDVDQNENTIIKLSPKAFNRVSPIDRKFRAKLSYIVSR